MSLNVYKFPPVRYKLSEFTTVHGVSRSVSLVETKLYQSSYDVERRACTLQVSSLANDRTGAGYMEMLKKYLAGRHLVRLDFLSPNYHLDRNPFLDYVSWLTQLPLFSSIVGTVTQSNGYSQVAISNLPDGYRIRPGDYIKIGATVTQAVAPAVANTSGQAVVRLFDVVSNVTGADIDLNAPVSVVMRPLEIPRAQQPLDGDWQYEWQFVEIFVTEVEGGFVEIDPWN